MINDPRFNQYKLIKKLLELEENSVKMEKVMSVDICQVVYGYKLSWPKAIAGFFFTMDVRPMIEGLKTSRILFADSNKRKEFGKVFGIVMSYATDKFHVHFGMPDITPLPNLFLAISSILFVKKSLGRQVSLKELLFFASRLSFYRMIARKLNKALPEHEITCRKAVFFNCQYSREALLAQFCRKKGIETFTLTHGMSYVNYKKFIPIDAINGENVTTEKVLVWGDSNIRDLTTNFDIEAHRVFSAGNLLYPHKDIDIKQSFRAGIILLGRSIYDKGNYEILKIASELSKTEGVSFGVRLHPSLSLSHYTNLCEELALTLTSNTHSLQKLFNSDEYDFAIVNNSTTYFESMYHNLICLRFEPDENELFEGLDDKFFDLVSLNQKITSFKNTDHAVLTQKVQELLIDNLGMGIDNYKQILND